MFHNISNPKWFGNWSRLEDDYLGNGGTDIADNFTFSKMEKTGGLFGSIVRLATAFPACDPETGHATGAWKVACESIDLDEVPLSDIADMISGFDCETITDFQLFNIGAFDDTPWQQALGELLLRLRVEKDDYQWIQCPNSESAVNMMNMVMDAHMPKNFFDDFICGDEEYGLNKEAHEMDSDRDDTMIAVLADVDEDGFPLIAALRPGGNAVSEGRSVGGTIVCSFYGKPENYFRFKMQQMPQRVLYQDIEKGRELDARAKLQLFGSNIASPDLDRRIIRPPECIVKLRADTPQMETHGRETSRVRRESRDMASGRAALDAGRRAETARVTERHIDSNLK